jgi:acetyl-CoA acetyltransferase
MTAVIVEALRTPIGIGKPEKGDLCRLHPVGLGAQLIRALVTRTGIEAQPATHRPPRRSAVRSAHCARASPPAG